VIFKIIIQNELYHEQRWNYQAWVMVVYSRVFNHCKTSQQLKFIQKLSINQMHTWHSEEFVQVRSCMWITRRYISNSHIGQRSISHGASIIAFNALYITPTHPSTCMLDENQLPQQFGSVLNHPTDGFIGLTGRPLGLHTNSALLVALTQAFGLSLWPAVQ
jgi:hypothetical protein